MAARKHQPKRARESAIELALKAIEGQPGGCGGSGPASGFFDQRSGGFPKAI